MDEFVSNAPGIKLSMTIVTGIEREELTPPKSISTFSCDNTLPSVGAQLGKYNLGG